MHRVFALGFLTLLGLGEAALAAIVIDVGNHDLLPNTPGQTILIFVRGGDPVEGLNLNVQIEDGGPELVDFGGSIAGPAVTDVDILTGTIFEGNSNGSANPEALFGANFRQLELRTTTTVDGSVPAEGLLATLTINTEGFFSGVFQLKLGDTLNGATDFAGVPATVQDGTISIVPEAGSLLLGGLATSGVCALGCRRRQSDRR